MPTPLPGWVIDDADSVRQEAAPYLAMTPAQRLRDLKAVCRAGARLLRARSDAELALAYRDPLPESTLAALSRLRKQARERSRG